MIATGGRFMAVTTTGQYGQCLASAQTAAALMWAAVGSARAQLAAAQPQDTGAAGVASGGVAIVGTTGSSWQPVGLANLGNLTAF